MPKGVTVEVRNPEGWECQVCGVEEAVGVASLPSGAMSVSFGRRCLDEDAYPAWWVDFNWDVCDGKVAEWFLACRTYAPYGDPDGRYASVPEYLDGRPPDPSATEPPSSEETPGAEEGDVGVDAWPF